MKTKTTDIQVGDRVAYKRNADGSIVIGTVSVVYTRGEEEDKAEKRGWPRSENMFNFNRQHRDSNIAYRLDPRTFPIEKVRHPVTISHNRLIEVEDATA